MSLRDFPSRFRRVTSSRSYNPQIDGLRLLALLPVLVWHAYLRGARSFQEAHQLSDHQRYLVTWIPDGQIGVILFFFISGFVIAFPFLNGTPPKLGSFYKRRLYRLEPPYILALLICLALVSFVPVPENARTFHGASTSICSSFLASVFYLHGILFSYNPRLLPAAWSLEIEIQFYLLSPLLLWGYQRIGHYQRRVAVAAVIMVASIVITSLMQSRLGPLGIQRWTLIGHFYPFALGIIACDYAICHRPFQSEPRHGLDLIMVLALVGMAVSGTYQEWPLGVVGRITRDFANVILIALVFIAAARGWFSRRILGNAWIALIGGMCYSIYLVHTPLMHIGGVMLFRLFPAQDLFQSIAMALVVLIPFGLTGGFVYYVLVERPCMEPDWPQRLWARLTTRPRPVKRAAD